jgi:hypothetical protein
MADANNNDELIGFIASNIERMRSQMATTSDIARLEARVEAQSTAIRGDIEQVHMRLDSMDHNFASRFLTCRR